MPRATTERQIAVYPNETIRALIEAEAKERFPGGNRKKPPLGPTVLAIVVEHFKKKRKI